MIKLLVLLAIAVAPFATSFRLNLQNADLLNDGYEQSKFENTTSLNATVSLKDFTIYKQLGESEGASGSVIHLAKKNGDSDDGKVYALKGVTKPNFIQNERKMLEVLKDSPWVTRLHYAFRNKEWLFFVMEFAAGGSLASRIKKNPLNVTTTKLILAELISAIESLHKANISHSDISRFNILIDSDGHLVLTDLAYSGPLSNGGLYDWKCIYEFRERVFPKEILEELDIFQMFETMKDDKLPELKGHPFFSGIDWEKVAERTSDPPFEPMGADINMGDPFDSDTLYESKIDEDTEAALAEEFRHSYFVAPEH